MSEHSKLTVCDFHSNIDNQYNIFSNYANTPIKIDGVLYPSTEHYFHSKKFEDKDTILF